jgi:hypothetical protein
VRPFGPGKPASEVSRLGASFALVTAPFLICFVPTLLLGSLIAA